MNEIEPANEKELEKLNQCIIAMAIESWRFSKVFLKIIEKIDVGERSRFISQQRYFLKKIEDSLSGSGYKLSNLEGQKFDPGIAAKAVNLDDFSPDEKLIVEQMIEPVILKLNGDIVKMGTIILKEELK